LTVAAPGVLANDTSPNGSTLSAGSATTPGHGSVALAGDGSFTYTPNANFSGTDTFTYLVTDDQGAVDTGLVTITVIALNRPPVAANDSATTAEDTPLTVAAPGVLANDTDPDGDALTVVKVSDPTHGNVALGANGSFTYTPAANYNGPDAFTYKASDGTADSTVATVNLTVTPVNDAPVAGTDYYSTAQNTALRVPAPGVLANDTDAEGDPLTAGSASTPAKGNVVLNSDGSFTYVPAPLFTGTDAFTYAVSDGKGGTATGTANVAVGLPNRAPTAANDSYSANEDTALAAAAPGVLANDVDVDGNALTAIKVTNPTHGSVTLNSNGSFTYTPAANYNGPDSFTYKANDGTADSNVATVNLTVSPVNDAPAAANDSATTAEDAALTVAVPGVLANDTDIDGNNLSATKVTNPAHGAVTLNSNGSFTYTPAANYNGPDSFTYKANDGSADSNVATVNLTVTAVNDAPTAANDSATTAEDAPLTVAAPGVLGNDSDADGNALSAAKVSDPAHGAVTLNSNGSFTYTPAPNYNGADSFTYTANDGTADSNVATVTLTVTPVNDAPVANGDSYTTASATALSVPAPGVLANDTDIDGDALSAASPTTPAHGTVTLGANGSFTYTPTAGFGGTDSFTYAASDANGGSSTATVSITVTAPGDTRPTTVAVGDLSVNEANSGTTAATFTLTRSGNTNGTSTLKYKTSGGTATAGVDYSAVSSLQAVSFGPGETTKTVSVAVTADSAPEANETFNLVLSAPTGATLADTTGVATIVNDDGAAYVVVDSPSVTEGNSGDTPVTFTLTRSGNTAGTSTLKYKTSGGTAAAGGDYTAIALTAVDFAPGQTTKTVTAQVSGDTADEANETFNLVLSAPSGGTVLSDATGTATIVDDEGPVTAAPATFVSAADLSVTEGNSGTTTATFTLTRTGDTTGASAVKARTSGGTATATSDYSPVALSTVSFGAGESTKTLTVDVTGDGLPEANETFNLVLSASTGATISDTSATATVVNDDGYAYLSVDNISVAEGNAATTPATFTLTRSGNTTGASSVKVKTSGGTAIAGDDYATLGLATVSFGAGETTKTVTVDVTGDTTAENNETFNLVLSTPVGATVSDTSGTASIVNDD
jgi:VCBS repeat-containing protein